MDLRQKIEEIANPFLDSINGFIVETNLIPGNKRKIIRLYVDTDTGITIDQCADINRQLGIAFRQQDIITDAYVLQVSSPGLNKPLKFLRQYHKNIGKKIRVRFRKEDKIIEIIAELSHIDNDQLLFITETNEPYAVFYKDIIESVVELPW